MEFLVLLKNIGKESRNDRHASAQYTQELKLEAVRQLRAGQSIAVIAKVLDIPRASLDNWARQSAKGELDGAGSGSPAKIT